MGRFTSADPTIQYPENPQSYNRYCYVLNNPLSFTDPTGFGFFDDVFDFVDDIFSAVEDVFNFVIDNIQTVAAIALAAIPGGQWAAALSLSNFPTIAAFSQGFAAGLIATDGDLQDSLVAAVTAVGFNAVGNKFGTVETGTKEWVEKAVAQGQVSGVSNTARGGDFLSGFLSAGVSSASTPVLEGLNLGFGGNVVATAVVGGTVSEIAGGSFGNGAITASFSYLYGSALQSSANGVNPFNGLGDLAGKIWNLPNTEGRQSGTGIESLGECSGDRGFSRAAIWPGQCVCVYHRR